MKLKFIWFLSVAAMATIAGCKSKDTSVKTAEPTEAQRDAFKENVDKVGQSVDQAYAKTKEAVKDGTEAAKDQAKQAGQTIQSGAEKATDALKQGATKVGDAFEKAGEKLQDLGK